MMSYDELELEKLGDEKTALFAVVSDTDPTFNFISAMMYSQMFNVLCDRALKVYHGRLPIHVTCLFDEFANQKIPNWEHLVSVIRSRNMSGKNPSRSCEDVDEAALSYAEVKALASGDPRIMEKTELDGQVTKLKLLKANHESQRYALEDNLIKFYPQAIKREQETIADLETDIRHLEAHTPPDKEHFSMTVMGTTYTEKKEAGQAIIAAFESLKDLSDKVELGEYRGFPMTLWVSDSGLSPKLQITLKHTRSHTFEPGSDPFGNITRMDNVLEGMRDNLEQHQTVLGNLLQQMEDAKVEVKRPFPQEAELAEKSERLAALNVALNIGGKDKPNSRERQKHDGKTSIKRLLRRMGVESAASAAPKKDKEMEVAI